MVARAPADRLIALLEQLASQLGGSRERLEALRRDYRSAPPDEAFEIVSEALDELERTLGLVREARGSLFSLEQRLTRRFDRLLDRLREAEQARQIV